MIQVLENATRFFIVMYMTDGGEHITTNGGCYSLSSASRRATCSLNFIRWAFIGYYYMKLFESPGGKKSRGSVPTPSFCLMLINSFALDAKSKLLRKGNLFVDKGI